MANRLMTNEEVKREIAAPLLQAFRANLINHAKPGIAFPYPGMGDCVDAVVVPPSDAPEFAAWKAKLQADFDATAAELINKAPLSGS